MQPLKVKYTDNNIWLSTLPCEACPTAAAAVCRGRCSSSCFLDSGSGQTFALKGPLSFWLNASLARLTLLCSNMPKLCHNICSSASWAQSLAFFSSQPLRSCLRKTGRSVRVWELYWHIEPGKSRPTRPVFRPSQGRVRCHYGAPASLFNVKQTPPRELCHSRRQVTICSEGRVLGLIHWHLISRVHKL